MSKKKITAWLLSATLLLTMFVLPARPVWAAEPPALAMGNDGFWDTSGGYGVALNGALQLPRPKEDNWLYVPSTATQRYFTAEFQLDFDLNGENSNDLGYSFPNENYLRFSFNLADPTKPLGADLGNGTYNSGYAIVFSAHIIEFHYNDGTAAGSTLYSYGVYNNDWNARLASVFNGKTLKLSFSQNDKGQDVVNFVVDGDATIIYGNVDNFASSLFPYTYNGTAVPAGSGFVVENRSMTLTVTGKTEETGSLPVLDVGADGFWNTSGEYGTVSNGTLQLPRPEGDNWSCVPSTAMQQYFTTEFLLDFDLSVPNNNGEGTYNDQYWYTDAQSNYLRFSFNLADPTKPLGADLGGGTYNSGYALAVGYNFVEILTNNGLSPDLSIASTGIFGGSWPQLAPMFDGARLSITYDKNSAGQDTITLAVNGDVIGTLTDGITAAYPYVNSGAALPAGSGFVLENRSMTLTISPIDPPEPVDTTIKSLNMGSTDSWGTSDYGTVTDGGLSLPRPAQDQWNYKASNLDGRYFQTAFILDFDMENSNDAYYLQDNAGNLLPDSNYFRFSFNLADPAKPLGADLGNGKYNSGYAVAFGNNFAAIITNGGNSAELTIATTAIFGSTWPSLASLIDGKLVNLSYAQNSAGQDIITLAVNGKLVGTLTDGVTPAFPYTASAALPAGSGLVVENRSMTATLRGVENINFADTSNWVLEDSSKAVFTKAPLPAAVELKDSGMYALYSTKEVRNFGTSFGLRIIPNDSVNYGGYDGYGGLEFRMTTNHNKQDGVNKINATNMTDQYSLVFMPIIPGVSTTRQIQLWAYNADKSSHYFCSANWLTTGQAVPEFDDGNEHIVTITAIDIDGVPVISVMIDGMLVLGFSDDGKQYYIEGYGQPLATDVRIPAGGYMEWFTNQTKMYLTDATGIRLAVDKNQLRAAIVEAKAKKEENYTVASWSKMQTALHEAETVFGNAGADQTAVDQAESNLRTAVNSLVGRADTNNITAAIERAKALKEEDYTKGSYQNMKAKLKLAESTAANPDATQIQLTEATAALNTAVDELVNITVLKDTIATAQGLNQDVYFAESWAAFEQVLTNAEALLGKENAAKEEINAGVQNLLKAIDDLQPLPTKDALAALITLAEGKEEKTYTVASYAVLKTAAEAAKTVLFDSTVKQTEVDKAADALQKAIAELVLRGNKTPLQAVADSVSELKQSEYTAKTWETLQSKWEKAKEVLVSGNAVQADVDQASQALLDAVEQLQPLTEITDLQMDPKDIQAVKGMDKQLIYVKKAEDGTVRYQWIFNGKDLKNTNAADLELLFNETGWKQTADRLSKHADGICLTTAFDKVLPGPADLLLFVGDRYEDGTMLQFYRHNDSEGTLETIAQNLSVYGGYTAAVIQRGKQYFLTEAKLDTAIAGQPGDVTETGIVFSPVFGIMALLAAAGAFLCLLEKKRSRLSIINKE